VPAGFFRVGVADVAGSTNSRPATLTVTVLPPAAGALSVLTYNVLGSGATNWSTNSLQVQAIGRQVQFLQRVKVEREDAPQTVGAETANQTGPRASPPPASNSAPPRAVGVGLSDLPVTGQRPTRHY